MTQEYYYVLWTTEYGSFVFGLFGHEAMYWSTDYQIVISLHLESLVIGYLIDLNSSSSIKEGNSRAL